MKEPNKFRMIGLLLFMHVIASVYAVEPLRVILSGGRGSYEGTVRVLYRGAYGTVCGDDWDLDDAHVVCHTLGYPRASAYYTNATLLGEGAGEIILDNVNCTGSESNIAFCQHNGYLSHNCEHRQDAGVTCDGIDYVNLQDGDSSREGRVRVRCQGSFGTVCDDGFGMTDANVVCRMLGYTFAESFSCCAEFGPGTGDILLDNLQCTGEEVTIGHCMHNPFGTHNCEHSDDVGVTCIKLPMRLADGASANEGRVEVNYQGSWGTICNDSWDINDATVVCRMLGYPGVSSAMMSFGEATGDIILDNVECDGSETHIAHCDHGGYEIHNCEHSEDVGVICSGEAELKVRLVGGPDESQGRVELFYFGSWGTVCHSRWTLLDSEVVCRMLGFVGAIAYSTHSLYGRGTGETILRRPRCSGKESSLLECDRYYDLGSISCVHQTSDVGVSCLKLDDLRVRLVGGRSDNEGRVEILYLGTWGTVCDDNWDLNDANVVCRMLGYERAENFSCCAAFGLGSGPIVLDEVECEGTEPNIGHCRRSDYETHDCDHSDDVGVSCIGNGVDQESSTTMTPDGSEMGLSQPATFVVDKESSTTMTPDGSEMGLSQPATFGLIGFLSVAVIGTLLGCIVMTVMMRKARRSANEASSQQQGTVEHHCYNGPQPGEEGYLELNVVPPKLQGGSSRDQDETYETPRHAHDGVVYEDIKI